MATYKSDVQRILARAGQSGKLEERVRMISDALWRMDEQLQYLTTHLGPENFGTEGLRSLAEKVKEVP